MARLHKKVEAEERNTNRTYLTINPLIRENFERYERGLFPPKGGWQRVREEAQRTRAHYRFLSNGVAVGCLSVEARPVRTAAIMVATCLLSCRG